MDEFRVMRQDQRITPRLPHLLETLCDWLTREAVVEWILQDAGDSKLDSPR